MVQFVILLALCATVAAREPAALGKPPIFEYDDPHECRSRSGTYCFVKTVRRSTDSAGVSPVKPFRLNVSFRRDLLEWGLCNKQCEDEVNEISRTDRLLLMRPMFPTDLMLKYPSKYFPELQYLEAFFGDLMHVCVNNRLWSLYNVTGFPTIEFCITGNYAPWVLFDWFACIFYVILFSAVVAFSMCNVLDLCGPKLFRRFRIIQSVSIRRNWDNLTKSTAEDTVPEIRCIEGLRFLLTITFIVFNCFMMKLASPVENPEKIEYYLRKPLVINLLSCMFWLVPVFLTVDGYLMMTHFLNFREKRPEFSSKYFRDCFFYRLIEMAPLYYLAILYTCVMDSIWGSKPSIGKYVMLTREARFCRQNFWSNMIFVNNYPLTQEMCFGPGWYFATALQLYGMSSSILAFLWMFPRAIKLCKWTIPIMCVLLPGVAVYIFRGEPLPPLRLNDIVTMFMYQPWYRTMYIPTHMNAGSYSLGMISGYYCYMIKNVEITLARSRTYKWIKRLALPLTMLTGTVPFLFYRRSILNPGLLTSVYAVLFHNSCPLFVGIVLLENFENVPVCIRRILGSRLFIIPTRLCYSLFIVHVLVLRGFLSLEDPRDGFELGQFPILLAKVFIISTLAAVMLFLVIEQPCRVYLGTLLFPRPSRGERSRPRLVRFAPMELAIEY